MSTQTGSKPIQADTTHITSPQNKSIESNQHIMSFEVSEGGAYAVLYCVLGIFAIIAFVASGLLGTSPVWEKLGCIMLPSFAAASTTTLARTESVRMSKTADFFLSARNSAGWGSIALSFFASGMVRH